MVAEAPPQSLAQSFAEALRDVLGTEERGFKAIGYRHDPSGSPTTTGYLHGPDGLMRYPGVDPDVFHTVVGPRGILGQLPVRPSNYQTPLFSVITGITADTGAEKTEVCGDAPIAGILEACRLLSVFGRYERQTAQLELNRIGTLNDRADPMDLRLVGTPIAQTGLFMTGPANQTLPGDALTNELTARYWALSRSLELLLSQQLWQGSPANNHGEAYKEITSFSILVNTGHKDVITDTLCPSVDSDIKNFNYGSVQANGTELVQALTYMYRYVTDLAVTTGLDPVRHVFAMRRNQFYEITRVWPCAYLTYRCTFDSDAARVLVDGQAQREMMDAMYNGRYLLIDGERIEVVLDDGIAYETPTTQHLVPAGNVSSDIYLIPMSVLGGRAVTYLEHQDYSNPAIQEAIASTMPMMFNVEGPWLETYKVRNWCFQTQVKIEPRLICRTPWLAGRLQHVVSTSFQMPRTAFPGDPYNIAGGVTSTPGPSYFNGGLWN